MSHVITHLVIGKHDQFSDDNVDVVADAGVAKQLGDLTSNIQSFHLSGSMYMGLYVSRIEGQ